ncbi:MAG: co-chaperone DjlA [Gammaproteobacteria bacterium]|nr:co-chaperone DjlA [Gammaproteobacteria bacterium]NNF49648.1 co-chaperone DjlA [Woeseiaceae bacterium]MBT8093724.1 co-chaperone DjlA [Gammaproteobacteria bacterium]MBT8105290.1 co-chaperone DjlA [Gammaproteobacteria bacterium]NNK25304.1 co-chaperone DjlA [Woeseiaceae bacterium]
MPSRVTIPDHMFLGKTIGLIVLLLVAYQFYRGFRSSVHNFEREGENLGRVSDEFVRALFGCMGHVAKSDGRVSEDEIRAARLVMHRLGLSPARVRRAIHWFDDGKRPGFPLAQIVRELRRSEARSATKRSLFLRLLLEVVLAKPNLPSAERATIWTVSSELGIGRVELAQLEAMIRAQKGFKRSPAGDADAARLRRAYATLGVEPDTSNDNIKKAYRRLMNRSHPDKIAGSNPDAQAVAEAERRTREVRGAYEMLKARRSIR